MDRLFYGNFDLEYELAGRSDSLPATVRRLNLELRPAWIGIAGKTDAIFSPEPFDDEWQALTASAGLPATAVVSDIDRDEGHFELCPWGWSPSVVEWGTWSHLAADAPSRETVRIANNRAFSLKLEQDWDVGLPAACIVRSPDELLAALRQLPPESDHWVLKAEFGMSGRERVRGRGSEPTESAANWVRNRIRRGESLILEPWVERIAEVGLQFTVPKTGDVVLEGVTGLLSDGAGVYRGSRFDAAGECRDHWATAIDVARRAGERIQSLGYFGPLGIDAVEYRDSAGQPRFRPLQDVNVRFTMGRLALGFRKLLRSGEAGVWLHQRWPAEDVEATRRHFERFCASLPPSVRVVRTSPFTIGGRPVGHGTVVVMGTEAELTGALPMRID